MSLYNDYFKCVVIRSLESNRNAFVTKQVINFLSLTRTQVEITVTLGGDGNRERAFKVRNILILWSK